MDATMTETMTCVQEIGETAGKVWSYLNDHGTIRMADLVRGVDESRDMVQRAVGWLAREDKVCIEKIGIVEKIRLK